MKEIIRTFEVDLAKNINPTLYFRVTDGPKILHEIHEELLTQTRYAEIKLTINYVGSVRK